MENADGGSIGQIEGDRLFLNIQLSTPTAIRNRYEIGMKSAYRMTAGLPNFIQNTKLTLTSCMELFLAC